MCEVVIVLIGDLCCYFWCKEGCCGIINEDDFVVDVLIFWIVIFYNDRWENVYCFIKVKFKFNNFDNKFNNRLKCCKC